MRKLQTNSIANALGFGLIVLTLSGCSIFSKPEPIEVSTRPVEKPVLTVPNADEINLRKLDWVLLTEENFYDKVEEIKQSGQPVVFFALTAEGYEYLSLNLSDIRALVQQQQAIIAAYKSYYDEAEKTMDSAVIQE